MKNITFLGGTGGLGSKVIEYLGKYNVKPVGSKLVNLEDEFEIHKYFDENKDLDVLIIFSNYNFNSFLHKYNENNHEINKQIAINKYIHKWSKFALLLNILLKMNQNIQNILNYMIILFIYFKNGHYITKTCSCILITINDI